MLTAGPRMTWQLAARASRPRTSPVRLASSGSQLAPNAMPEGKEVPRRQDDVHGNAPRSIGQSQGADPEAWERPWSPRSCGPRTAIASHPGSARIEGFRAALRRRAWLS